MSSYNPPQTSPREMTPSRPSRMDPRFLSHLKAFSLSLANSNPPRTLSILPPLSSPKKKQSFCKATPTEPTGFSPCGLFFEVLRFLELFLNFRDKTLKRCRRTLRLPRIPFPMRTTRPATRPAHSFLQLRAHPLHMLPPRLRFLHREYPADPFIARQRSNVLPLCPRRRIGNKGLAQIRRHRYGPRP